MADENSTVNPQNLRPIGTEFEYTFTPENILISRQYTSNWPSFDTYRYRVIGHVKVMGQMVARIEPVAFVKRQRARAIYRKNGGMDFEPIDDDETLVVVFEK